MKGCYFVNHEKVKTLSAYELTSNDKFYFKFDDDGEYFQYIPIKPQKTENKDLLHFIELNENCKPILCRKIEDDWNQPSELVIMLIREDRITEERTLDYCRGYRDAMNRGCL